MAAPATTRRTRKTSTRRARRHRLPTIGIGAAAITLLVLYAAIRTWPVQAGVLAVLIAAVAIARAIRPARLNRLWRGVDWIAERRRALPARGRRTLNAFHRMTPDGFEKAIAELALEHPHVHTATHAGRTADRGVDVLVTLHTGHRILIQCKRYTPGKTNVGGPTIRETVGSVIAANCHAGAIITTSGFTAEAYATNGTLGHNALALVTGDNLVEWANGGRAPWER
ncbi:MULTISPECIES: restriction endonuclease [unclassified Streptomyces]|uniref:restriction endonuclease n=1 Tax=unclassified Streptomyces TaxID=2593676 RepID=UPI0036EBE1F2